MASFPADHTPDTPASATAFQRLRTDPMLAGLLLLMSLGCLAGIVSTRALSLILPLSAVLILGAYLWQVRSLTAFRSGWMLLPLVLPALALLTSPTALEPLSSLQSTLSISLLIAISVATCLAVQQLGEESRELALKVMIVSGLIGVALFAFHLATEMGLWGMLNPGPKVRMLFKASKIGFIYCLLVGPFVLWLFLKGKGVFWLVVPLMMTIILFHSRHQTSSAYVLIWTLTFICAYYQPRLTGWLAIAGGIMLFALAPFLNELISTLATSLANIERIASGARFEIWQAVSDKIHAAPWLGYGFEASKHISDWPTESTYKNFSKVAHPHNATLQIWLNFGALGALTAALLWTALIQRLIKCPPIFNAVAMSSATASLLAIQFSWSMWNPWWICTLGFQAIVLSLIYPLAQKRWGS